MRLLYFDLFLGLIENNPTPATPSNNLTNAIRERVPRLVLFGWGVGKEHVKDPLLALACQRPSQRGPLKGSSSQAFSAASCCYVIRL